jgi:hypothetical protein
VGKGNVGKEQGLSEGQERKLRGEQEERKRGVEGGNGSGDLTLSVQDRSMPLLANTSGRRGNCTRFALRKGHSDSFKARV